MDKFFDMDLDTSSRNGRILKKKPDARSIISDFMKYISHLSVSRNSRIPGVSHGAEQGTYSRPYIDFHSFHPWSREYSRDLKRYRHNFSSSNSILKRDSFQGSVRCHVKRLSKACQGRVRGAAWVCKTVCHGRVMPVSRMCQMCQGWVWCVSERCMGRVRGV